MQRSVDAVRHGRGAALPRCTNKLHTRYNRTANLFQLQITHIYYDTRERRAAAVNALLKCEVRSKYSNGQIKLAGYTRGRAPTSLRCKNITYLSHVRDPRRAGRDELDSSIFRSRYYVAS